MATARSRGARIRSNVFAYANLAPYVFFVLFPFYFMVVTSFKSNAELYNLKSIPFWIQTGAIMDHYALLFQKTDFVTWMKNSLLVATVATTVSVVISILAGYSLARLRFRGAAAFGTAIFITYLIPPTLLFLPLSQVVVWLGLADSIYALMVIYPTFLVPFCTWLLMGYFRTIPREVEECALVDGATRMQTLSKIVLPMAIPGVICAVLFSFTLCWNEFTYALTFISPVGEQDRRGGGHLGPDPRRHLLLGLAHGGRAAGEHPDRDRVRPLPRLLRLRSHRRRGQGLN